VSEATVSEGRNLIHDTNAVPVEALDGLPDWLNKVPPGMEDQYGFFSREEMVDASLGAPWQMWTIPYRDLADAHVENPNLTPLDEWRFPVIVAGSARALLTVSRSDGGAWQIVAIGAAGLARELADFESVETSRRGGHENSRRVVLRLYASRLDFLSISDMSSSLQNEKFTPTRWVGSLLPASGSGADFSGYALADVVTIGRQHLQKGSK
jgi:hypothetical protein